MTSRLAELGSMAASTVNTEGCQAEQICLQNFAFDFNSALAQLDLCQDGVSASCRLISQARRLRTCRQNNRGHKLVAYHQVQHWQMMLTSNFAVAEVDLLTVKVEQPYCRTIQVSQPRFLDVQYSALQVDVCH